MLFILSGLYGLPLQLHNQVFRFTHLRLIERITSSVQASFICVFLGCKASNFVKKLDVTDILKTLEFEGFDREFRPRPI